MPEVLTETRLRILALIRDLTRDYGCAPTAHMISKWVELDYLDMVGELLWLCADGYLQWQWRKGRKMTVHLLKPVPEEDAGE